MLLRGQNLKEVSNRWGPSCAVGISRGKYLRRARPEGCNLLKFLKSGPDRADGCAVMSLGSLGLLFTALAV